MRSGQLIKKPAKMQMFPSSACGRTKQGERTDGGSSMPSPCNFFRNFREKASKMAENIVKYKGKRAQKIKEIRCR